MKKVRFFDPYQRGVLADRYLEAKLGDRRVWWAGLVWLVVLGAIWGVGGRVDWAGIGFPGFLGDVRGWFYLPVVALFFGYLSSCGVLLGERAMFARERAVVDLDIAAYLYSRVRVLSVLGTMPVLGLSVLVHGIGVGVAPGWLAIVLLGMMVCGVCLGLMVSAWVESSKQGLYAGVALLCVFVAVEKLAVSGVFVFAWLTPLGWGIASLEGFGGAASDLLLACSYLLPLGGFGALFLAIGYGFLKRLA